MDYSKLILIVGIIVIVGSASALSSPNTRVVGGVTARRGEFPHICSIQLIRTLLPAQHVCGANILNNQWVLTAASCIFRPPPLFGRYEILCGRLNLGLSNEVSEQRIRISQVVIHPDFNETTQHSDNDIALVRLVANLHYTNQVQNITLPAQSATAPTGVGSVIGWGGSDDAWLGQSLGIIKFSRVGILNAQTCAFFTTGLHNISGTTHICTGPLTGGLSPCNDDRGSSLTQVVGQNNVLIGVVSLPQACGEAGLPGYYTQVSLYTTWINGVIGL